MGIPGGAVPGGSVPGGSGSTGAYSTSTRPFGFGVASSYSSRPFPFGAAQSLSTRPFGFMGPPTSSYSRRLFGLMGPSRSTSTRPFGLNGIAASLSTRPFGLQGPPPSQWGGYSPTNPVYGTTSVVAAAVVGATVIYVNNGGAGFRVGQQLRLGSAGTPYVVASVSGGAVTLTSPLTIALPVGAPVQYALPANVPPPPTTTTGSVSAGSTTITVTNPTAYQPGQPILIGTEVSVVASVSGAVVTLQNPLLYAHPGGTVVTVQYWGFLPTLPVYSKAGVLIGSISNFTVDGPPSREIGNAGSARFFMPVRDASAPIVQDDRLVLMQTEEGEVPWAGAITIQESSGGRLSVSVDDMFATLSGGPQLILQRDVADDTPAATIYAEAIALHNANASLNGEIQWIMDAQTTKVFRGDLDFKGDTYTLLQHISNRSSTEFRWEVSAQGSQLVATIIARDRFQSAGPALHDTEDDPTANIVDGSISVTRDPTPIVQSIKLTGVSTDLSKCLPSWAQWAGHDVIPTIELSVPAGDHRVRQTQEVTVDWGLSHSMVAELCSMTIDTLFAMYFTFLRAIHDIEGRPYHPGYIYAGPTDYFETPESGSDALSRRTWRTRRQLVETFPDTPAAAIMISDSRTEVNRANWLIVNYNRATGEQSVQYWGFPAVAGASMTQWHIDDGDTMTIYYATGGRIYNQASFTPAPGDTAGTGAFVESYNTRLYDPTTGTYRYLRRILNGGFAFNGNYVGFLDPSDPDIALTDLGTGAAIDLDTLGELIGKVYDFELLNIETWDPRRDGIGEFLSRETVFNGAVTTVPRWHRVPWGVFEGAATALADGINADETIIQVTSVFVLPQADAVPFKLQFGDGTTREIVNVISMEGTLLTVERGQDGTTAQFHDSGTTSTLIGGEQWDGFVFPWTWPQGQAYAEELLARLSVARILLNVRVAMAKTPVSDLVLGAVCPVTIVSEGVEGYAGDARIIGVSPDALSGETEVVVEYPYVSV